jgi:hypothetical protein
VRLPAKGSLLAGKAGKLAGKLADLVWRLTMDSLLLVVAVVALVERLPMNMGLRLAAAERLVAGRVDYLVSGTVGLLVGAMNGWAFHHHRRRRSRGQEGCLGKCREPLC